jgi:Lrp/AsnC ligand binding domain
LNKEAENMKAYVVITAKAGTARDIATGVGALPGVIMADACWGTGDVYAVVNFPTWPDLNGLVMEKIHSMNGVLRTETHVAVEP